MDKFNRTLFHQDEEETCDDLDFLDTLPTSVDGDDDDDFEIMEEIHSAQMKRSDSRNSVLNEPLLPEMVYSDKHSDPSFRCHFESLCRKLETKGWTAEPVMQWIENLAESTANIEQSGTMSKTFRSGENNNYRQPYKLSEHEPKLHTSSVDHHSFIQDDHSISETASVDDEDNLKMSSVKNGKDSMIEDPYLSMKSMVKKNLYSNEFPSKDLSSQFYQKSDCNPIVTTGTKKDFVKYMTTWLRNNWTNPYNDDAGLEQMAKECNTSIDVISNWLINARTRKWRPALRKAISLNRPADMLYEDSISIFDHKPISDIATPDPTKSHQHDDNTKQKTKYENHNHYHQEMIRKSKLNVRGDHHRDSVCSNQYATKYPSPVVSSHGKRSMGSGWYMPPDRREDQYQNFQQQQQQQLLMHQQRTQSTTASHMHHRHSSMNKWNTAPSRNVLEDNDPFAYNKNDNDTYPRKRMKPMNPKK